MMAVVIAPGSGGTLATTKLQNAKSGWVASGGDATVHVTLLSIEKVIISALIKQPKTWTP
jgi:hypothetical protein